MTTFAAPRPNWLGQTVRRSARLGCPVLLSAGFLILVFLLAVAAPLVAPHDPTATDLSASYQGSSSRHLLGTDELGRDITSRLIWGARASLAGPLLVVLAATVIGLLVAVATAWRGGRFDSVTTGILDVMLGFPGLLLALLTVALFGVGLTAPVVALTIAYTPYFARLTRSTARQEKSRTYIAALRVQGYGGLRTCLAHIVPNILPLVLAQATLLFGYAMVDLAAISYLGLGVQPPTPDWGSMVAVGQAGVLAGHPQVALSAGLLIVLTVVALNIVGEGIADRTARGRQ